MGCGVTLKQEVRAAAGRGVLALIYRLVLLIHRQAGKYVVSCDTCILMFF